MARRRSNRMGSIRKRGDAFQVRLTVDGEVHSFTKRDMTREEVERWARAKALELEGTQGLPGPEMRFSALLTRFRDTKLPDLAPNTRDTYSASLRAFRAYFVTRGGDPRVAEVRAGHIQDFLSWFRTHRTNGKKRIREEELEDGTTKKTPKPLSARSLAKTRTTLHRVFAFAESLEVIPSNPVKKVEAPKGDAREPLILDAGQYEKLLEACEDRPMLHAYVLVLGEAGLRCESEALWLRWQDLDFEAGFLTVAGARKGVRTKSGKSRKVPMTRRLREALRNHAARFRMATYRGERSPWVFHHLTDRRRRNAKPENRVKAGERIGTLRRGFGAAVARAKLPEDLHQHDLRHRRVTTWLQEGHPIHLVKEAMGHSTVKVTEGYLHLVATDLLSLVEEPTQEELKEMVR